MINWEDFEKIDIRVGTILSAEAFPKARKPAYRLKIDFGDAGTKASSAQITELYNSLELIGMQVIAVINFPPKKIADFISECLILGIYSKEGVVLLKPHKPVDNGLKIG
jgi:tRNA-binding protein